MCLLEISIQIIIFKIEKNRLEEKYLQVYYFMLIGGEIFAMTEEFLFVKISWNINLMTKRGCKKKKKEREKEYFYACKLSGTKFLWWIDDGRREIFEQCLKNFIRANYLECNVSNQIYKTYHKTMYL